MCIVKRQVHIPVIPETLACRQMVVLLLVIVGLVIIVFGYSVFFIFTTGIIRTVCFQHGRRNSGPCLIRLFITPECLETD